jgi:hypothetical protein
MGDQHHGQPLPWTATIREQVATAIGDQRHEQLLPWTAVIEEQRRETAATVDKRTQGLLY